MAAIAFVFLIAGCTHSIGGKALRAPGAPTSQAPVAVGALDELLLSAAEMDNAVGSSGITVRQTDSKMYDDSIDIPDAACRIAAPVDTLLYAGSGWTALRVQYLRDDGDTWTHEAEQAVVVFASAHDASAFYTSSAQRWQACSSRQYHVIRRAAPDLIWTVGAITNTDGMLSFTRTREGGDGWACHRVLTTRNNVAIDVVACAYGDPTDAAVNIANQIATKVAKQ